MTETQTPQAITFQQLSEALALLGFKKHDTPEFTMFRNVEFNAVIILPVEEASSSLRPTHLAAARATVVGKGVTSPAGFDLLLLKAASKDRLREGARAEAEAATLPEGNFVTLKPKREVAAQAARVSGAKAKSKKRAGVKTGQATL
jgi:hypothetical protein